MVPTDSVVPMASVVTMTPVVPHANENSTSTLYSILLSLFAPSAHSSVLPFFHCTYFSFCLLYLLIILDTTNTAGCQVYDPALSPLTNATCAPFVSTQVFSFLFLFFSISCHFLSFSDSSSRFIIRNQLHIHNS